MIEWLKGEAGGLVIAVLGYVLREFSENHRTPERVFASRGAGFLFRFISALSAGVLVLAAMPEDTPNYIRVAGLAFAGAATPEIVRLLITKGLAKLDAATDSNKTGNAPNG